MRCNICERIFSNEGSLIKHSKTCEFINSNKDEIIDLYVNKLYSINELKKKFRVGGQTISDILGDKKRLFSESMKVAHKKFPDKFKHSEESKDKIRKKRIEYMKNNPDATAWRKSNLSYPESLFLKKMLELKWDEKYAILREFCIFPYYIDFAFPNNKLAVEIDGSQHLIPDRKNKDEQKDKLLIENGWSVVRVTEKEIKTNMSYVITFIENKLNGNVLSELFSIGVYSNSDKHKKKEKDTFGYTKSVFKNILKQRRVKRPNIEELKKNIEENGYVKTGLIYGVSDNAIRKWLKFYERTGYEN